MLELTGLSRTERRACLGETTRVMDCRRNREGSDSWKQRVLGLLTVSEIRQSNAGGRGGGGAAAGKGVRMGDRKSVV